MARVEGPNNWAAIILFVLPLLGFSSRRLVSRASVRKGVVRETCRRATIRSCLRCYAAPKLLRKYELSVLPEIAELIASSGNNFHARVARWFQSNGWLTTVSPYYLDDSQNKAREIDLICEKSWDIKDGWGHPTGHVVVRLFVECKFVPSDSVFWLTGKDLEAAKALVCSCGPFRPNNTYTDKHHYLSESPKVIKLFATRAQRGGDAEPFYKALNQSLHALVAMRPKPSRLHSERSRADKRVLLDYPVIVCSSFDRLHQVDFFSESEPQRVTENLQLEVRYAYTAHGGGPRDEYFLLDVVEFNQLDRLASALERDAKSAAFLAAS